MSRDRDRLHVVSVSLGSAGRDARIETELLGRPFLIERRGVDGDVAAAGDLVASLDGRVDAIGLGGLDLYVVAAGRRYPIREAQAIARRATRTPVVCGAALKHTLERKVVAELEPLLGWRGRRVLMLAAVDRFGMAEELAARGADMRFGDLVFTIGVPVVVRSLKSVAALARVIGPVVTKMPISWIYPTGGRQESSESGWRERYFRDAEVIAGDFLFVKRYAPNDLRGKIVLTNTTTADDVEMLRQRGASMLITTTPRFAGRSLATNLLEAALVALAGRHPLSDAEYASLIEQLGLGPNVLRLDEPAPVPLA